MTESILPEKPRASEGQVSPWTTRAAHAVDTIARALAELDGAEFQHSRYTRAAKAVVASLYGATWARACHSLTTIVRADVADLELGETCAQVRSDQLADVAADAADTVLGLYDDHLAAAYDQAVR